MISQLSLSLSPSAISITQALLDNFPRHMTSNSFQHHAAPTCPSCVHIQDSCRREFKVVCRSMPDFSQKRARSYTIARVWRSRLRTHPSVDYRLHCLTILLFSSFILSRSQTYMMESFRGSALSVLHACSILV